LRRLGWLLAGLLVVGAVAIALLPLLVRGPRLAWAVRRVLPPMLGQINLSGGRLSAGTVFALVTGRRFTVELEDLRVLDPEGTVVLASAHLSAQVAVHRHPARVVVSDLRPGRATWRLGRMQHHRGIGFVAAFLAPARAGGRARGRAAVPAEEAFVFELANADLDGLDATFDFPSWGLELGNVKAAGSLLADTRDPDHHVFGFDVHDIDARAGGTLRILDGAQAARLPFERALIRRVAITPQRQNDLQLDVETAMTGLSRLGGQATFGGVVGIAGADTKPGLTVAISLSSPAEALAALGVGTRLGPVSAVGSDGVIALRLTGPYEKLTATLTAHDLDLAYGGRAVGRAQLDATASMGPLQADIRRLTLTAPGGGRIDVRGSLNQALELMGDVKFHHVATEGYLPPYLRRAGTGILDGEIQMKGGLASGAAAISRLDVTWERPTGAPAPRLIHLRSGQPGAGGSDGGLTVNAPGLGFVDGVLTLRRLSLPALGGRLLVDGQVRFWQGRPATLLPSPQVSVEVRADGVDVDQAGLAPFFSGRLAVAARVRGSLDRLAMQVRVAPSSRLIILGDAYAAAAPVDLRWQASVLTLSSLTLLQAGGGSRVELGGHIGAHGEGDVHLIVADHDLFGLPGLRDAGLPMRGRFDARLRLQGRLNDPALSGEATIKDVALNGQRLGGGTLTLEPAGHRGAHVWGTLFDAFSIDGVMADKGGEPQVDLAVTLQQAKLDPLVPALPPLLSLGRATATGQVSMQLRGGRPVVFDAHFTDLRLSYQLRAPASSRAARPARRVGIRSVGSVDAHMIGWGTELTLADAGFDFGAGALRASGTVKRGVLAARAHGPIDLRLLAPLFDALAPGQIDRLSGKAEADVRLGGSLIAPQVQGTVGVVRAVEVGLRALPGGRLNLTAGTLAFDEPDAVRLEDVAASLRYEDSASFTQAEASLRLDARLAQLRRPEGPTLTGELTVASAQVTSLALGDTVRVRDARVSVRDGMLTVPALEVTSDHHGHLSIGGAAGGAPSASAAIVSTNPFVLGAVDVAARGRGIAYGPESGLRIDDLDLDLRLRGDARRSLTLSGDVALRAGRFQVDAPKPPPPATPARTTGHAPGRPRPPTLPDRIALDVRLRSDGQRFVIKHRFLPDLRLRLDLHAGGTVAAPKISGHAGATDVYSWLALLLVRPFR
jgi:hypothetical protein